MARYSFVGYSKRTVESEFDNAPVMLINHNYDKFHLDVSLDLVSCVICPSIFLIVCVEMYKSFFLAKTHVFYYRQRYKKVGVSNNTSYCFL